MSAMKPPTNNGHGVMVAALMLLLLTLAAAWGSAVGKVVSRPATVAAQEAGR